MSKLDNQLPSSWHQSTLEDISEIHDNLREPVNASERSKRHGSYPYYGATGQVGWINDFRQDGEFILLGEDGAPFFDWIKEKAYLVNGKCWVNNHAHVLKGKGNLCLNRYLLHALNQTDYRGYANGTTRLKLTQSAMKRIPINLAPFAEQHRIVAKIEELFSELDKGIESLKTAHAQLKVYRQALLKHAFEGKLTADWREQNKVSQRCLNRCGGVEAVVCRINKCGSFKVGGTHRWMRLINRYATRPDSIDKFLRKIVRCNTIFQAQRRAIRAESRDVRGFKIAGSPVAAIVRRRGCRCPWPATKCRPRLIRAKEVYFFPQQESIAQTFPALQAPVTAPVIADHSRGGVDTDVCFAKLWLQGVVSQHRYESVGARRVM